MKIYGFSDNSIIINRSRKSYSNTLYICLSKIFFLHFVFYGLCYIRQYGLSVILHICRNAPFFAEFTLCRKESHFNGCAAHINAYSILFHNKILLLSKLTLYY